MNSLIDKKSAFDIFDCPPGFYAEWVPVYSEEDKKDAYEFLRLWKKFLLLKLDYMQQKGQDYFIDHSTPEYPFIKGTIGLKIELEAKNMASELK